MEAMMIPAATTQNIMQSTQPPQNYMHTSTAFDFTRSGRSKCLDDPHPDEPGPGQYNVAQEYPDYRGIYVNMGKVRKTKKNSDSQDGEGEESEDEEEEVRIEVEKASDEDDEDAEAKDIVVEDVLDEDQSVEEEPKKQSVSHIPGYS
jgi:hypothetical protein